MKKKILLGGIICMLFLTIGCTADHKAEQNMKLYDAIMNNNLQGVKEAIKSEKDINFEDLGTYETTPFAMKDGRALAIALSDSDDAVVKLLIKSGARVDGTEDKWTYLHETMGNRSLDLCKALINNGADVNAGEEPVFDFFIATVDPGMENAKEKAELLIKNGAKIDKSLMRSCLKNEWRYLYAPKILEWLQDKKKQSGLEEGLEAAIRGDDTLLQKLIEKKQIKNTKEILLFAAANCNISTLEKMVIAGYDFSIEDDHGMTPLHVASLCNTKEVVAFLLSQGADINKASEAGNQAVTYAAVGGNVENLKFLLSKGATYQQGENYGYDDEDGEAAVWTWDEACCMGTGKSVDCMLKSGYIPTKRDCNIGYSACTDSVFHELLRRKLPYNAPWKGELAIDYTTERHAEELLQRGAKVSSNTLCKAIEWRNYDMAKAIWQRGVTPGNTEYTSPLVTAISIGDYRIVCYLVENGADINQRIKGDDGEFTPMHIAADCPSAEILQYLIEHGGNSRTKDSNGDTPYDYAKAAERQENMKLLK